MEVKKVLVSKADNLPKNVLWLLNDIYQGIEYKGVNPAFDIDAIIEHYYDICAEVEAISEEYNEAQWDETSEDYEEIEARYEEIMDEYGDICEDEEVEDFIKFLENVKDKGIDTLIML